MILALAFVLGFVAGVYAMLAYVGSLGWEKS